MKRHDHHRFYFERNTAAQQITDNLRMLVYLIDADRQRGFQTWNWTNYNEEPRLQQLALHLSKWITAEPE